MEVSILNYCYAYTINNLKLRIVLLSIFPFSLLFLPNFLLHRGYIMYKSKRVVQQIREKGEQRDMTIISNLLALFGDSGRAPRVFLTRLLSPAARHHFPYSRYNYANYSGPIFPLRSHRKTKITAHLMKC